ncbi:MAG: D-aminoacylase [Bacillota bacterium]|nr:D-aminoacylase [Bacillota bacterium]
MFETVIQGATVVDGSGGPAFAADVGISEGRIGAIRRLAPAADVRGAPDRLTEIRVRDGCEGLAEPQLMREPVGLAGAQLIDGGGLVLAPGFIDIHNHSDLTLLVAPRAESMICQGVTTVVVGNCGFSPAPWPGVAGGAPALAMQEDATFLACGMDVRWEWRSFAEYLAALEAARPAVNVVALVGHAAIREQVLGRDTRAPGEVEMRRMRALVEQALADGAAGMSSGLIYYPSCYATTAELVALAAVVACAGRIYASHVRGEGETLLEAISEAIEIARRTGASSQVSHLKAESRIMWGKLPEALALIDAARREGHAVGCDQYPYAAYNTSLGSFLPPEVMAGDWRGVLKSESGRRAIRQAMFEGLPAWTSSVRGMEWTDFVIDGTDDPARDGRDLGTLAAAGGRDPYDFLFDLLLECGPHVRVIGYAMSEADVERGVARPDVMVGSDGFALPLEGDVGGRFPHPRSFGTFPRVLGHYCRDRGLLSLEAAVHKMTGLPAGKLSLRDRGLVREGYRADLVLFDPRHIRDTASFARPKVRPVGISWVFVNGRPALTPDGWGERAGQVIH